MKVARTKGEITLIGKLSEVLISNIYADAIEARDHLYATY
jgi:hypothetical protein